jgi:flap endonuclease-1
MGIPKLNKILMDKCSQNAISKIHLKSLYKKKVAVDISIYLYRFLGDGNFMENVYLFLSLFKYYCIEPIFVFDGKPPPEKQGTIKRRKIEKRAAKDEYDILENQLEEIDDILEIEKRKDIVKRMDLLKKKMVRVKWEHIDNTIELLQEFGFIHYLAPNEADQLCVHLAKRGDVYAVVSDDMDMIISGCSHVIRNLNMSTHDAFIYNNDQIIRELDVTLEHFRQIVILSGTDYNNPALSISIKKAFDIYSQYKNTNNGNTFYEWLHSKELIMDDFMTVYKLIETDNSAKELDIFLDAAVPQPKKMSVSAIKSIMRPYRFIFL